jgi:TRAP-type C4-dicarboxylate transport system permease small subunit
MTNTQLIILIALGCFLVGVVVGWRLSRISRTQQVVLRDWPYLSLQLVLTLFIGVVIIWVAYNFVTQTEDEKSRVIVEAIKDFGVVVAGIAVVEIMWTIVGGSPVDKSLEHVTRTMSNFNHSVCFKVVHGPGS